MLDRDKAGVLILVIVIIALMITFFVKNNDSYDNSKIKIFFSIVTGLGIMVTFFFYYNVVELQYDQQRSMMFDRLETLDEHFSQSYIDALERNYDKIPDFIKSLLPLQYPKASKIKDSKLDNTSILEYTIAVKIFCLWKEFIVYYPFISNPDNEASYISQFLQRASSPQLKEYWASLKIEYSIHTQTLGDLLFENTIGITNTAEGYREVSKKILESKEYKKLVTDILKDSNCEPKHK